MLTDASKKEFEERPNDRYWCITCQTEVAGPSHNLNLHLRRSEHTTRVRFLYCGFWVGEMRM